MGSVLPNQKHSSAHKGKIRFQKVLLIFSLTLYSFWVTCSLFLRDGTLYWDNAKLFDQFRDNLHSLNFFGEFAWWAPHRLQGFPSYYHSFLGVPSCGYPLFVLLGSIVWLLGKMGIILYRYQPLYVFYFGFLSPLLLVTSTWSLARQIFQRQTTVYFVLILASLSPGVITNISDIGFLEPCAYGLFFAASWVHFIRRPSYSSIVGVGLCLVLLALTFNNGSLYWNVVGIPSFLLVVSLIPLKSALAASKRAITSVSLPLAGVLMIATVAAFTPNFLVLSQGTELVRSSIGDRFYQFENLMPGNPIEVLISSLPGFGLDWTTGGRQNWGLIYMRTPGHVGYFYLGILCLPYIFVGLIFGRTPLRWQLMALFVILYSMVSLAGFSPLFASALLFKSPLQGVNHFSDLTYRLGGYLIAIFASGLGFDAVLKNKRRTGWALFLFLILCSYLSMRVYSVLVGNISANRDFGFLLILSVLMLCLVLWLIFSRSKRHERMAVIAICALTLVDISTVAYQFIRKASSMKGIDITGLPLLTKHEETPAPDHIGLKNGNHPFFYSNSLLEYRRYTQLKKVGFEPGHLPFIGLYSSARAFDDGISTLSHPKSTPNYVVLSEDTGLEPSFKPFLSSSPKQIDGTVKLTRQTYNQFELSISATEPSLLFLRDAYSPHWKATVNGKPTPVGKAFYHFKAIAVPRGESNVIFKFRPIGIGLALGTAYSIVIVLGIVWWLLLGQQSEVGESLDLRRLVKHLVVLIFHRSRLSSPI